MKACGACAALRRLAVSAARSLRDALTMFAIAGMILGSNPGTALALDALATPQGGRVVAGAASFGSSGAGNLTVTQTSNRAVIDWNSFNIGESATAEFKQPGAKSIAVNRVTGGGVDPTQILGTLKSNGQVMVLDPNGVLFGERAQVDVGGLIASTGTLDTGKFMSGASRVSVSGMGTGTVENRGRITAKDGGLVALVAPHVVNSGLIQANLGSVELASGSSATLDLYGDNLVTLAVQGSVNNALVENSGRITANGGQVLLTAKAAAGVVTDVVNTSGIISARAVKRDGGRIILSGGDYGTVHVSGQLDVSAAASSNARNGGRIEAVGYNVYVDGASIDASGNRSGGRVFLGGGLYGTLNGIDNPATDTMFSADSVVNADALVSGRGGTVVVWGSGHSAFYGNISARGGALRGDGGLVEVSTGEGVIFEGIVDTSAAHGTMGELLIDPFSVQIGNGPSQIDGSYLNAGNLADTMVFTSVIVMADNNIDIVDAVDLARGSFGATYGDFILQTNTINLDHDILMGNGSVSLQAAMLNMGGKVTAGGNLLRGIRITGTATAVNVSNGASIQQAVDASGMTPFIQVGAGSYDGSLVIGKALTLSGNAGNTSVAGADVLAPEIFSTAPVSDLIMVTAAGVTIEGFNISAGNALTGIHGLNSGNLTISNNTISISEGSGYAIMLENSPNSHIEYNDIVGGSATPGVDDILLVSSDGTVVSGNTPLPPPPPEDNGSGSNGANNNGIGVGVGDGVGGGQENNPGQAEGGGKVNNPGVGNGEGDGATDAPGKNK
jgi:filamentous hemagglutinin family protein